MSLKLRESTRLDGIPFAFISWSPRWSLFIWYQYHLERPYVNLALIPAESHYRLFLYDAYHVFILDYLADYDQLPDQYLKGRQHPYSIPFILIASGYVLGRSSVLVVPVATLAVSFLDSGEEWVVSSCSSGAFISRSHRIADTRCSTFLIPQGIGHDDSNP